MSPNPPAVRRAVILAAGMGTRLRCGPDDPGTVPKPLVPLAGKPLVQWVLEALFRAGIARVTIVVGWRGEILQRYVAADPVPGLALDTVWNDEWEKSNGVSLLKARAVVDEPFVLLMADHVFEDRLLTGLLAAPPVVDGVVLAVDRRIDAVFDLDDATKVRTQPDGRIVAIGKQLADYDAVDCGLFLCQPAVFAALTAALVDGNCSLSDGMRRLAEAGRFQSHDVAGAFWQDVDTPEMFAHAAARLTTA